MTPSEWRDKWFDYKYEQVIDDWDLTVAYVQDGISADANGMELKEIQWELLDAGVVTEEDME